MKVFGIFDFDFYWTLSPLCGLLWAAGGSGPKLARRAGVPLSISVYAIGYGFNEYYALLPLLFIAFGPGYGDRKVGQLGSWYWPFVFGLGALWGLSQIGLCLEFGNYHRLILGAAACSAVFGGTMLASKKAGLPWKVAEIMTGMAVGMTGALVINANP